MIKGMHLTDRDIEVFKYLAYGPAFEDDLHVRFFVGKGKRVIRKVLLRRMKKLLDAKFISCLRPKRMQGKVSDHRPVYFLAEAGINLLGSEGIMPAGRVRHVRLDARIIFHEVIVTRLIRKIYEGDPTRYRVIRLYDHQDLAKLVHKARKKRIPDLRFTVQLRNGSYFSYIVEIDAGTTHMPEFIQKLIVFLQIKKVLAPVGTKEPVGFLIVAHTSDRMARLQRAVIESRPMTKLVPYFLFNTIQNIDNHLGLYNAWYRADGRKIDLIFKGKRST